MHPHTQNIENRAAFPPPPSSDEETLPSAAASPPPSSSLVGGGSGSSGASFASSSGTIASDPVIANAPSFLPSAAFAAASSGAAAYGKYPSIRCTELQCGSLRFLICDTPDDDRSAEYVCLFKEKGVTDIARACKPKYDRDVFEQAGISVHEFYFEDGGIPDSHVLDSWMTLVHECVRHNAKTLNAAPSAPQLSSDASMLRAIAVHCVAGLGRAPLLVAVAFIEYGMTPLDTIDLIRSKRRGSLNSKQIRFLLDVYKPKRLFGADPKTKPSSGFGAKSSHEHGGFLSGIFKFFG